MPRGAKSRMRRTETPKPIWIKFCTLVDIADIVTHTNFGDHRLRGFWGAGGQISPFPIDFHRRPYNTLALPCERVIVTNKDVGQLRSRQKYCVNFFLQKKIISRVSIAELWTTSIAISSAALTTTRLCIDDCLQRG